MVEKLPEIKQFRSKVKAASKYMSPVRSSRSKPGSTLGYSSKIHSTPSYPMGRDRTHLLPGLNSESSPNFQSNHNPRMFTDMDSMHSLDTPDLFSRNGRLKMSDSERTFISN